MQTSPLQLDEAFVGSVSLRLTDHQIPASPSDVRVDAQPSYAVHEENPLKWNVKLSVEFGALPEKSAPYEGRIDCEGYFTIADATLSEERQLKIVAVNCPTILYSTAREVIANLTARARQGKLLLPSVSFIDQMISVPKEEPLIESTAVQKTPKDVTAT